MGSPWSSLDLFAPFPGYLKKLGDTLNRQQVAYSNERLWWESPRHLDGIIMYYMEKLWMLFIARLDIKEVANMLIFLEQQANHRPHTQVGALGKRNSWNMTQELKRLKTYNLVRYPENVFFGCLRALEGGGLRLESRDLICKLGIYLQELVNHLNHPTIGWTLSETNSFLLVCKYIYIYVLYFPFLF